MLRVGVITSTHGIKGEVKVFPTTDDAKRFKELKEVILDTGKEQIPMEIEHVKFFKNMVILKFKGHDDINEMEKYKSKDLLVTRDQAVALEPRNGLCQLPGRIVGQKPLEMSEGLSALVKIIRGNKEHFYDALTKGSADAALAASLFHYKELEIRELKEYLAGRGIAVRM